MHHSRSWQIQNKYRWNGLNIRCKVRRIYGRFDSKIRFDIESDGRFDSRFDSNAKKRFAGPYSIDQLRGLMWNTINNILHHRSENIGLLPLSEFLSTLVSQFANFFIKDQISQLRLSLSPHPAHFPHCPPPATPSDVTLTCAKMSKRLDLLFDFPMTWPRTFPGWHTQVSHHIRCFFADRGLLLRLWYTVSLNDRWMNEFIEIL